MKLHRLALENLNSLYGEHELDLDGQLGAASLFLVVGPTGAGKSTLLDAICLALFGRTPRLGKASSSRSDEAADARQVMSHGTGRCRAEVEFSKIEPAGRVRYRAIWAVRRARESATGAFQKPERSLEQWDADAEQWVLLVSDGRAKFYAPDFDRVLEGMDLDQFQRAILLAQGQFAAFLEADEATRAAILERLTGTEQFRRIGERANRKRKEAVRRVDDLEIAAGEVRPLDEAARAAIEARASEGAAALTGLQAVEGTLRAELAWGTRWSDAAGQHAAAKVGLTTAEADAASSEPALRRLAEHERCAQAAGHLNESLRLEAALAAMGVRRASATARQAEAQAELTSLVERRQAAHRALVHAEAAEAKQAGPLAKARETAGRIVETDRELREVDRTVAELQQTAAQLRAAGGEATAASEEAGVAARLACDELDGLLEHRRADLAVAARLAATEAARLDLSRRAERIGALLASMPDGLPRTDGPAVPPNPEREQDLLARAEGELAGYEGLRWALRMTSERAQLQPGSACPLCGSAEHADSETFAAQDQEAERKAAALRERLGTSSDRLGRSVVGLREADRELAAARDGMNSAEAARLRTDSALEIARRMLAEAETASAAAAGKRRAFRARRWALLTTLQDLVGDEDPTRLEAALKTAVQDARTALDRLESEHRRLGTELAAAGATAASVQTQEAEALTHLSEHRASLEADLARLALADRAALQERILELDEAAALGRRRDAIRTALTEHRARVDALQAAADALEAGRPPSSPAGAEAARLEEVRRLLPDAIAEVATVQAELAAARASLAADDALRGRASELDGELTAARADAALWRRLHSLIGVGDGDAFKRFAQVLNLGDLVDEANVHLERLTDRYRLRPACAEDGRPTLSFVVEDRFQGGQVRPTTTLSGGERFLVSLALALGLGQLRSNKTPLETLLLDEGFGTLDQESQSVAMSALDRLQATGTQVGIISHVDALREKIPAQVLVEKLGDGRSRIRLSA